MTGITNTAQQYAFVARGCPRCLDRDLQRHSLTVWCLRCGWASNWDRLISWTATRSQELAR